MAHAMAAAAALGLFAGTNASTTTTTTVEQVPPLSGEHAAEYLNKEYMGLKEYPDSSESNPDSSIGVVIHPGRYEFFCSKIPFLQSDCYAGDADCMCSTSVYNHKMILSDCQGKGHGQCFQMGLDQRTGVVFNTSMVHSKLAKCAYQYDGATARRYNHGCGGTPVGDHATCDDPLSAFYNLDPATNTEVTDESELVVEKYCPNHVPANPKRQEDDQCYWKGKSFFPPNEHPDELRHMIDQRLRNQLAMPDVTPQWNEVVLDVEAIYEELRVQPALVIPAMLWVKKEGDELWNTAARELAQEMAAKFQKDYEMPRPVPVVAVQDGLDVTAEGAVGPFLFDGAGVALV